LGSAKRVRIRVALIRLARKHTMGLSKLAQAHEKLGKYVTIENGTKVFVRDEAPEDVADPEVVVMVHGVPSSSFLYRKMFAPLVAKGLRAVAFDFPGLGLSGKTPGLDFTWGGLKEAMRQTLEALGIERMHLVIHDIGGPIAAWYAVENKDKVASITILDTLLRVHGFKKPFPMWTFEWWGLRRMTLATFKPSILKLMFGQLGVRNSKDFTYDVAAAWTSLLAHDGGHESFLKIMAGFELTQELEDKIKDGLQEGIALQVVWADGERSIPASQLRFIEKNFPLKASSKVRGRHFLQEDSPEEISEKVHTLISSL
ncbi:Haloalkane dehalogenase, partial [Durusdinium trenchii]